MRVVNSAVSVRSFFFSKSFFFLSRFFQLRSFVAQGALGMNTKPLSVLLIALVWPALQPSPVCRRSSSGRARFAHRWGFVFPKPCIARRP